MTGPGPASSSRAATGLLPPDLDALKSYGRIKLALASQLHVLHELLEQRGNKQRAAQCQELMVKLAEDRFTLAVLGQFARGKSSLMNAVIGRDLLPTGMLPLTSMITALRFGPKERLVIEREGTPFPDVVPISQLEDYVTERGNSGNRKRVKTARLEAPLPVLRRGLEFVDTPGIGSAISANTAITYAFLPACDAVLFVTSVDTPLTSVELKFLDAVRQHVGKIFFVVNKTDLLAERERREVLDFVVRTVRERLGAEDTRVFPLSCRLGLAAKRDGDASAYDRSGLKSLEDALSRFLSEEKTATFLAAIVDKATRLLLAEAEEANLYRRARALPEATLRQRLHALHVQLREHALIRRDIFRGLRWHVLEQARTLTRPEIESFVAAEREKLGPQLDRVLAHCSWQPWGTTGRELWKHTRRRLHRNVRRSVAARREQWSVGADDVCRQQWQQLEANLSEIPALAAATLALDHPDGAAADTLPPWSDVEFDGTVPYAPQGDIGFPLWIRILPARVARPWLRQRLLREHSRLLESLTRQLATALEERISTALDQRWDQVSEQADHIESRVLAAITGQHSMAPELTREIDGLRQALRSLRDEILQRPSPASANPDPPPATDERTAPTLPAESPAAEVRQPELATDLATRGCPVCDHLGQVAFAFFSHWQYALYADATAQAQFAAELGFCPLHLWQLEAVSSPVGSSAGYAKFAERLSRALAEAADSPAADHMVRTLLQDARACRVCRLLHNAERRYVERLVALLADTLGRETYARAQGVCLAHLALVVAASDHDIGRFLLAEAGRRFEEVAEDMQAFAMKTDAVRRGLLNEDEHDAYWRAITHIAGAKGVSAS
jgi:predicted GTPase